jgi:hypothetical protein
MMRAISMCVALGIGGVIGYTASIMVRHGDLLPLAGMMLVSAAVVAGITVLPTLQGRADRERWQ